MAIVTGSTITYGVGSAGGNREDLEDVIWELEPLETYALTTFDRTEATATFHEWLRDRTVAPTTNRQLEGDASSFASIVSPTRLGNYCQISTKQFLVSRTQEKVAKAGRKSEVKRQLKKQMKELKDDMEYAIVRAQGSSAGGTSTVRSLASIESWIASTDNGGNGVRATTTNAGSTVGFSSGVVAAPTDGGSFGALTEAKFLEAIELAWQDGGKTSAILTNAGGKKAISAFAGVATKTHNVEAKTKPVIAGSVDVYVSEFGTHNIILHRHVRGQVVLAIDPEFWAVAMLDAPFMEERAKTSDGTNRALTAEFTLVSRNPDANAKVFALNY